MKKSLLTWATTLAVVGAMALPVMAGGGGGGGGGRGGRGGGAAGGGMGGGGMGGGGMGGGGMGGGGMAAGGMGGGGGGRGAMTPEQQVTTSLQRIQTSLNMAAGDEWTVLSAKIQKVLEDQQKLAAGAQNPLQGGGRGGRGGMGGGAPTAAADTTNPLAVARDDLSKAVATGTTTDDASLKTKMTAVRDQRKKLEDQLTTDQKTLQALCSVRQEAILVSMGVLN
jgi:hypothetical protein